MSRNVMTIVGFLCFFIGLISIVLSLVGLRLSIISFADNISPLFAFVFKLFLLFGGMVIFYMGRSSDYDPEMED